MRVVILGSEGLLGTALMEEFVGRKEHLVYGYDKQDFDVTNNAELRAAITRDLPTVIINATGYTDVDGCETHKSEALKVNAEMLRDLGRIAESINAKVVHYSTDFVFNGEATLPYKEDAITKPINVYGISKLLGESLLRKATDEHLIIRTQWLFGPGGRNFPFNILKRALKRNPTTIPTDQIGRLAYAPDIATATHDLLDANFKGIIHVSNKDVMTKYTVAWHVYRFCKAEKLLTGCTTEDVEDKYPAKRPKFSVLNTDLFNSVVGYDLPSGQYRLLEYIREKTS